MNVASMLAARADADRPVRMALICAGKFGAMYLNQAQATRGIHVTIPAIEAPISPSRFFIRVCP